MKKVLVLSALFAVATSSISWKYPAKTKQGNPVTISSIKLAEAKAMLSKANTRHIRSNLSTADGGI